MSSMALKMIAVVCMTIDHTGVILAHLWDYNDLASVMRMVGRIAFPLFCFLIAEGMRKTKSRPKYLLWLGVFAIISLCPFSLFNNVNWYGLRARPNYFLFSYHNVFFTLFFGAASIFIFDLIRKGFKGCLLGIPGHVVGFAGPVLCAFAAFRMNTDYGRSAGVLLIFSIYWVMSFEGSNALGKIPAEAWRFLRAVPMVVWVHTQYRPGIIPGWVPFYQGRLGDFAVFAAIAPLLVLLYDGSPGPARLRGASKIWFYVYYPAHLLALFTWSVFLRDLV
ncbi:MAG: conjugal transfer protein TraX [Defluviitaleaceae bacterium]|nr:conjugal transfer protein TraX [Defluviitaleaceae bacterium]MCL2836775.1 conjugal transfer protein TraX [Defluviitaleaceae bacterium]